MSGKENGELTATNDEASTVPSFEVPSVLFLGRPQLYSE